jgi:hypothetical protein
MYNINSVYICVRKWCTRLADVSDKVYQLLAYGRWFSPGTPASSTTKTGRHDIAEILLKVALNTKINQINTFVFTQTNLITLKKTFTFNSAEIKPSNRHI